MFRRFWQRRSGNQSAPHSPAMDPVTQLVAVETAPDAAMAQPIPGAEDVHGGQSAENAPAAGEAPRAPASAAGPASSTSVGHRQEPQLSDDAPWKARFRAPSVMWTQVAQAEPSRGLAASNRTGVVQLYAWDMASGALRQLTHQPKGKSIGELSPDGRYVYYLDDHDGNELGHFVRVPFEGGAPTDISPELPHYAAFSVAISRAANRVGFIAANADGFQLFVLDLGPDGALGVPRRIYRSDRLTQGPLLSAAGELAVVASTERTGANAYSLVALDVASGDAVAELWDEGEASIEPAVFCPLPGDSRLLATSNRTGVKRPFVWNPRTGERTELALGQLDGEVMPLDWSADGARLLLCHFDRGVQRLYTYDLATGVPQRLDHPAGSIGYGGSFFVTYFAPDGEIFAQWQDATHPTQVIALDAATGARTRTVLAASDVPPSRPWQSVTFTSSDGQAIQGWLALPEGEGPFPTILETHGGPTAVLTETFSPACQAWLDHGFAFLSINYRGSTTFGKAFEEQIWGDLGHWEIEDMVAARDWLVQQRIAQPEHIFLTGWSYGGYLTLLGLGKRPDLWAGGMAGVAVADWSIQYEDSAETLRGYQRALFRGTPEERPELYVSASPITYVEQVAAPVLVIQGRNDTRCPARPMDLYEQRMGALGKPIEVIWFDAGHGSLEVEQLVHFQEVMLRFAHSVLRGD